MENESGCGKIRSDDLRVVRTELPFDKVKGLADINLVQQGGELSYLILHDPDFRLVRREHLVETGRRIRLKDDVALFARVLDNLVEGRRSYATSPPVRYSSQLGGTEG
jgi:hypothetical protein